MRSTDLKDFPPISLQFIQALETFCPPYTPSIQHTDREIWVNVGQRLLVERIIDIYKKQKG